MFAQGNKLNIFLELASGGSVTAALQKFGPFSEAVVGKILLEYY
jgi:hypothetical protein